MDVILRYIILWRVYFHVDIHIDYVSETLNSGLLLIFTTVNHMVITALLRKAAAFGASRPQ